LAAHEDELVRVRRHLHANPELGHQEHATTQLIADRLSAAGLVPKVLPKGTGLVCDVGTGGPIVALRGDLDALPIEDSKDVAYRSSVPGVSHACGHDVHTTAVLGAGLALAAGAADLQGTVRLIFQPAEETVPGGALDVIAADALDGVSLITALHCDPRLDSGLVGVRVGTLTAAADGLEIRLEGPGGHTARPHLTVDLVDVLARLAVDLPAHLARVVDPRSPFSVVWGAIGAGQAGNVIPNSGFLRGTVRTPDIELWSRAQQLVTEAVTACLSDPGATVTVDYRPGVPPVVNEARAVELLRAGVTAAVGPGAVATTEPSMGGEDFGWYLQSVPGAMARLGVRRPGEPPRDLHQGTFDVDESAIAVGVRALVGTALAALG
jgi:amidohydrolase